MTELDKLEQYLRENRIKYERIDDDGEVAKEMMIRSGMEYPDGYGERHQIIVYDDKGKQVWDAICHWGSYGYEQGLLEVMGDPVVRNSDGDSVCGWLTAQDIIDRLGG